MRKLHLMIVTFFKVINLKFYNISETVSASATCEETVRASATCEETVRASATCEMALSTWRFKQHLSCVRCR